MKLEVVVKYRRNKTKENIKMLSCIILSILVVGITVYTSFCYGQYQKRVRNYCQNICYEQTINDFYKCVNSCYQWEKIK
jgi:hypothetical protein